MRVKINEIKPEYYEQIPLKEEMQEGILYIVKGCTVIHLCACGCGIETVTPLTPPGNWTLVDNNGVVTLRPSIGNTISEAPEYHAHYFIINNKIVWH